MPKLGAVAEVALDQLREPVQVGDRLGEAMAGEQTDDVLHHRPVEHRHHRLRHRVGDRAQPGSQPGREDHRSHWRRGGIEFPALAHGGEG